MARFDEFVENVAERVDPAETDAEVYIGLEHLDSESLLIRRNGAPDDVIGQKLLFKQGDIIFGRRRAYQRKLGVAHVNGICSAHALVVRARSDVVEPDYLPFFMQSELFMARAQAISVGSLSPTINWKTLRAQEFPLPPKSIQREMAELFLAADATVEGYRDVVERLEAAKYATASQLWRTGINHARFRKSSIGKIPSDWSLDRLEDHTIASAYGPRFPASQYAETGNVQTVRTTDFDRVGGLDVTTAPFTTLKQEVIDKHALKEGDFLLSRSGEYAGLTATFKDIDGCFIAAAFVIRFQLKPSLLSEYLVHLCYSDFGERFVMPLATGSAQPNISGTKMLNVLVPVPPISEQRAIVAILDQIQQSISDAKKHLQSVIEVMVGLRNRVSGVNDSKTLNV
jgi:restriction endonuclease S subunit